MKIFSIRYNITCIGILFLLFCTQYSFSQESKSDSLLLENIVVIADTAGGNSYKLVLTVRLNDASQFREINVSGLDDKSQPLNILGEYAVKKHENGFYYLENKKHEKITVMGNQITFIKLLDKSVYKSVKEIKVDYKTRSKALKSSTYSIKK